MTAFIADEHIPAPSVETLRAAGFDVLSIREQHPAVSDIEIVRLASAQNRVIVTCDSDFGELIYLRRLECRSGVVFLRLGDFSVKEPGEYILRYLVKILMSSRASSAWLPVRESDNVDYDRKAKR